MQLKVSLTGAVGYYALLSPIQISDPRNRLFVFQPIQACVHTSFTSVNKYHFSWDSQEVADLFMITAMTLISFMTRLKKKWCNFAKRSWSK